MAAQVAQVVVHGVDAPQQRAAELTGGIGRGLGGFRVDQVDHGLGLRQVELPVQKGAFGEFAGQRLPRARGQQRLQPGCQHGGRAVALQLHGVLTGVAVRRAGVDGECLVDHAALPVAERAEHQLAVRRLRQRHPAAQGKDPARGLGAAGAGQSKNADRAGHPARRDGGNDVTHLICASRKSASFATRPSAKGDSSPFSSAKARSVEPALL